MFYKCNTCVEFHPYYIYITTSVGYRPVLKMYFYIACVGHTPVLHM